MLRALEIAQNALPQCQPNPPVGCVLVKDNLIVSEGYTQKIGGNHAEVEAILAHPASLSNVTAYVTLEPCSFEGRTPSCAKMLVDEGISKVIIAMLDPDPRNNGKGVQILESAGVIVELGLCQKEVNAFLAPYLGHS